MVSRIVTQVEGLKDLIGLFEELPSKIQTAAVRSVNKAARDGRSQASKLIRSEVALSRNYLANKTGVFWVSKQANKSDLAADISARERPTSLARFTRQKPSKGKRRQSIRVTVKPGSAVTMAGAFLVKLRQGTDQIGGSNANLGLAIRTRGRKPDSAYKPVKIGDNLYLLYGPSVAQVFLGGGRKPVAETVTPFITKKLDSEFERLLGVDL